MAFDYLWNLSKWNDDNGDNPPEPWELVDKDGRYWFNDSLTYPQVDHAGTNVMPATLLFEWEITEAPTTGNLYLQYDLAAGGQGFIDLGDAVAIGQTTITNHLRTAASFSFSIGTSGVTAYGGISNGGVAAVRQVLTSDVNCEYETLASARTLSDLRAELLRNTGYGSQVNNLPDGVEALYNSFLRQAQIQIATTFRPLVTERFFRFPLQIGVRYYELRENVDDADIYLDPERITSVHLVDNNDNWSPPLRRGIPPNAYTTLTQKGYPALWDINQCIEIFPAPQAEFNIYIKGRFELAAFASDSDYTTIPSEPVLQYALGLAKNNKRRGSGGTMDGGPSRWTGNFGMAANLAMRAVASQHVGRRYVPQSGGGREPEYIVTRPEMESFIE